MPVTTVPSVPVVIMSQFDLRRITPAPAKACTGSADEIVVCARHDVGRDRVHALDDARFTERPVRAEVGLAGSLSGAVRVDSQVIGAGQVSQRVLVGIKMPF